MNKNILLAIGAVLAVVVVAGAAYMVRTSSPLDDTNVITQGNQTTNTPGDTTGDNTGTVTPTPTPTSPGSGNVSAAIGKSVTAFGITITPLAVVEDSRCPQGVQCIQAGTVRVRVRITTALGSTESVMTLSGDPVSAASRSISFIGVAPVKTQGTMSAANYNFTFAISAVQ